MTESLAEYDRQQDTLLKENKRLLKENEDLEIDCDKVKREECGIAITFWTSFFFIDLMCLIPFEQRDEVKEDLAQTLREIAEI